MRASRRIRSSTKGSVAATAGLWTGAIVATAAGVAITLAAATAVLPPPAPDDAYSNDSMAGSTSVLGSSVAIKYTVSAPRERRTGVGGPSFPLTVLSMRVGAGEFWLSYSVSIRSSGRGRYDSSGPESVTCRILANGQPVLLPGATSSEGRNGFVQWRQSGSAVLRPSRLTLTCQSDGPWLGTVDLRDIVLEAEQQL